MDIVVDVGDGSGSKSLTLLENLLPQVTFKRLHDRQLYDKDSAHVADPSEIENMKDVIEVVKGGEFAAGFSFDSDADRVLAVDENGEYVNGSVLAGGLVECFHSIGITCDRVGYAVECGPSLYNTVVDVNKTIANPISIIPIPVGRSLVRNLLFTDKIDVGVENVGHFYVKDFFMTDSAVFVMCCMLYWMSQNGKLSGLNIKHPDGFRSQTKVLLSDSTESNEMIENNISTQFQSEETKKIIVDGIRYEVFNQGYMDSWYTIRKSGYEPIEKIYYGSLNPETFDFLSGAFRELSSKSES
jgi:phosphomannomutase